MPTPNDHVPLQGWTFASTSGANNGQLERLIKRMTYASVQKYVVLHSGSDEAMLLRRLLKLCIKEHVDSLLHVSPSIRDTPNMPRLIANANSQQRIAFLHAKYEFIVKQCLSEYTRELRMEKVRNFTCEQICADILEPVMDDFRIVVSQIDSELLQHIDEVYK